MTMDSAPIPGVTTAGGPGFIGKLFDLSFETSITTTLIKVLYVLLLVGAGFGAIGVMLFLGIAGGSVGTLLGLLAGGLMFALSVIGARVYCELLIVLFRVAENTRELVRLTRDRS